MDDPLPPRESSSRIAQQTLPTVFPRAYPSCVLPSFFVIGIIFLVLGSIILRSSDDVFIAVHRYDNQNRYQHIPSDPSINIQQGRRTFTVNGTMQSQGSLARVLFSLSKDLAPPIYLYYGLSNFYQNYLDYHDGRSALQLAGSPITSSLRYKCEPFLTPGSLDGRGGTPMVLRNGSASATTVSYSDFTYYPCGVTAWSMFNDSFTLYSVRDTTNFQLPTNTQQLNMSQVTLVCNGSDFDARGSPLGGSAAPNMCAKSGISWDADVNIRFKDIAYTDLTWAPGYPVPTTDPYLSNGWYAFEAGHSVPHPLDLDFQVWMRIAAAPSFRKLYRIIQAPLAAGSYVMEVEEFFDAASLNSEKNFQIRVDSWLGMPNYPIGIAYIAAGSLAVVLAVGFLAQLMARLYYPRQFQFEDFRPHFQFAVDSDEMKEYVALCRERREEQTIS